jgi:Fur family ferric uptake transcriptional regulator
MSDGPHTLPSLPKGGALGGAKGGVKGGVRGWAGRPPQGEALPYEPVCAVFRRYLHGQRLKFTPERAMILDAVLRQNGLFEADQLVRDLEQLGHQVSRATAYRTLTHLQDAGILKQVFFDSKRSYYEVIAGRQTYDYLICVATGRVIEFNSEKIRRLCEEICREHGFEPLSHQLQIYAVSPEGRSPERPGPEGEAPRGAGALQTTPDDAVIAPPGAADSVGKKP